MDTFELLPTLAQGELSDTSAPELVAAVFRSRASGTLWLETEKNGELRMFFRAGDMCGTGAFASFKTLAHVLLEHDWVNALDIDSTGTEALAAKKRHGQVLVERGLLTQEQLREALAAQHRANLMTLLLTARGRYDWRGSEPPPAWAREVAVDPIGVIIEALLTDQHAPRRRHVIDWLGANRARFSPDWPELQGRVDFEETDRRSVALLEEPRTIAEFMQESQLPPDRVEALFAALLLAGALEPDLGERKGGEPEPEPLENLEPEEDDALVSKTENPPLIEVADDDAPLELDFERSSRSPAPAPAQAGPAEGSNEDRSRDLRKKMVARGMRNLGVINTGPIREESEGAVAAMPAAPAAIDLEGLGEEDRAFVEEVRNKARLMDGQNAYARLSVSPGAPSEAIKQAYLEAAKRYHPDRASSGLGSLQPELQRVFHALKEAYEQVATPELRARYDKELKLSGAPRNVRRDEASVALKMGEVLLKKRDFEGAIAKLRRAVDLDASGDALAALAWALSSDPKQTAAGKEEAATLINRALRAPGATARTYYVAGVLWRTKDPDSAVDAFRQALEIDPNHSDAALELRLIEQRRGKAQKGGGTLSGLLFGKRKPGS